MRMKLLLENFKKFSTLTEDQLIVEGRIDDARKKYPALNKPQEDLDGKTLLDILIDADPSGNQKYLMGAAKLADRLVKKYNAAGDPPHSQFVTNVANTLQKYHKVMPFIRDEDAKFKDINAIPEYARMVTIVRAAEQKKEAKEKEKEKEAETKRVAVEGTEFVTDTPYHRVVRPLTKEGSCYFGRQTKWCISAERSANYFDDYTNRGKAFFFLLATYKDPLFSRIKEAEKELRKFLGRGPDTEEVAEEIGVEPKQVKSSINLNKFRKMAVVIDENGDFEEYFDSPDDSMTFPEFVRALRKTMIGADLDAEIVAFERNKEYDPAKIVEAAEMLNVDEDDVSVENLVQAIDDEVLEYIGMLQRKAAESVSETPAGTPPEKFDELLANYNCENLFIELQEPYETGYDHMYFEAGASLDINDYLEGTGWEWKPGVEEELGGEHEQDVVDAVRNALEDAGFYVYGGEVEQDYDDPERVHFSIRYTAEHDIDKLDVFEGVLVELFNTDK